MLLLWKDVLPPDISRTPVCTSKMESVSQIAVPFEWALILPLHCRRTSQDIANVLGALYIATTFVGVVNSLSVQPFASAERLVSTLTCSLSLTVRVKQLPMEHASICPRG